VTFSQTSTFDNIAVAIIEGHQQRTENDRLITSYTVNQKLLSSFKYTNKSLLIKYFTVSMRALSIRVQLIALSGTGR
jgi:hypothetical protein